MPECDLTLKAGEQDAIDEVPKNPAEVAQVIMSNIILEKKEGKMEWYKIVKTEKGRKSGKQM